MRKKIELILGLSIAFQFAVLGWTFLTRVHPIWTGKEIHLQITGYDPRSLFRGNYVALRYQLNPQPAKEHKAELMPGDRVYISLEKRGNFWEATDVSLTKPDNGLFIKAKLTPRRGYTLGLEAYFAFQKRALELERELRKPGKHYARVNLGSDGTAVLREIVIDSPS